MTQAVPARPADRLNDEHATAAALLQLLEQEQRQLIDADLDGITRSTEEKARLLAQLGELTSLRYASLAAAGYEAGEAGMRAWLGSGSGTAGKQWQELLDLARSAKELNRTNGLLIGQHLARNNAALNVLQGGSGAGGLYGPTGMTTGPASTRGVVVG